MGNVNRLLIQAKIDTFTKPCTQGYASLQRSESALQQQLSATSTSTAIGDDEPNLDNWQAQRLQQLQQLRIQQQLISSAPSYHFQGDAIVKDRSHPSQD
jgi:hypothetical protein